MKDIDWYTEATRKILTFGRPDYSSALAVVIAVFEHSMTVSKTVSEIGCDRKATVERTGKPVKISRRKNKEIMRIVGKTDQTDP